MEMMNFLLGVWVGILICGGISTILIFFKPLFPKNAKWTVFIWLNLNRLAPIKSCYFHDNEDRYFLLKKKQKNYVVSFMRGWLYHIYEGSISEEIQHKYNLGGQSNKADYLKFWEKWIGKKIEEWYKSQ